MCEVLDVDDDDDTAPPRPVAETPAPEEDGLESVLRRKILDVDGEDLVDEVVGIVDEQVAGIAITR